MSLSEIPYGVYDVEIGESFTSIQKRRPHTSSPPDGNFHTLKYDFKPKSVASEQETYISLAENRDVQVVVPNEGLEHMTVYKGSKKPIKGDKECVLVFDHERNQFKLEKFSSNISVKKTRDNNLEDENSIKEKIQQMRLLKKGRSGYVNSNNDGNNQQNASSSVERNLFDDDGQENYLVNGNHASAVIYPNSTLMTAKNGGPPARVSGGERSTSFSGVLADEAATSPSASGSSSSSSSSGSDSSGSDSSSSSEDEADNTKVKHIIANHGQKALRKSQGSSHESDDEHVQAIEKMMSESRQPAAPAIINQHHTASMQNSNANVVLSDLYMSDDNPSDSASDCD